MAPATRNRGGSKNSTNEATNKLSATNQLTKTGLSHSQSTNSLVPNEVSSRNTLNNSYIAMVSDSEDLRNTELDVTSHHLRNKLAQTEFELMELREQKMNLANELESLEDKLAGKQLIIDNLHATIEKLTISLSNKQIVVNANTQTDLVISCEESTQSDLEMEIKGNVISNTIHQVRVDNGSQMKNLHIPVAVSSPGSSVRNLPRVLLLGDSQFRGIANITRKVLGSGYCIQTIFKPNALFENVVDDVTIQDHGSRHDRIQQETDDHYGIRHEGLLTKMKVAGFQPRILKTIRSYLKDRRFHTVVNGTESSERQMLSGVPQDSALFSIYVADIPKPTDRRVFNAIYADDTAIVATSKNPEIAAVLAQAQLDRIEGFFSEFGLTINPRKTQAIAFSRRRQPSPRKITVLRTEIDWSEKIEYLGMILDRKLTFAELGTGPSIDCTSYILSSVTPNSIPKRARCCTRPTSARF
ncbi:reverse transcriptase (rna-dependent dna polymerase) [Holotrichia oblita]|uniref:Reverse transcriptase (Rna-dependent dna polymerase) n=1 Tax=Holotrichia oblita TaxID=644536 RepID=A0ACB9T195_HOLOL|nr:reverse transcriptase (rna-dependent dna polymerase) [Holotrichia oblita]